MVISKNHSVWLAEGAPGQRACLRSIGKVDILNELRIAFAKMFDLPPMPGQFPAVAVMYGEGGDESGQRTSRHSEHDQEGEGDGTRLQEEKMDRNGRCVFRNEYGETHRKNQNNRQLAHA